MASAVAGGQIFVLDALSDCLVLTDLTEGKCRRYQGAMMVDAMVRGKRCRNNLAVRYEVGFRDKGGVFTGPDSTREWFLDRFNNSLYTDACSIKHCAGQLELLSTIKTKTTFAPNWCNFDFDEVVRRLAICSAALSFDNSLSGEWLLNSRPLAIMALINPEQSHNVNTTSVFISSRCAPGGDMNTFVVLAAAVCGTGVSVSTEFVRADVTGSGVYSIPTGGAFAVAVMNALGVLALQYEQCGAGRRFALALFSGLHSVGTVVSHSDEGGFTRDVLRNVCYRNPHGAIPPFNDVCRTLPGLAGDASLKACGLLTDTLLILSAAAVAHCDPLVKDAGGRCVSTILESPYGNKMVPEKRPKRGEIDEYADHYAEMRTQDYCRSIRCSYALFADMYTRALATIVGFSNHDEEYDASDIMQQALDRLETKKGGCRHLNSPAIAPYFWIEPTTVLPRTWLGTPAEVEGLGSFGRAGEECTLPYLPGAVPRTQVPADRVDWQVAMTSPRLMGAVLLCLGHREDGLASIIPSQWGVDRTTLFGAMNGNSPKDLLEKRCGLHEYLWGRGQSKIPHPAELNNLNECTIFHVVHATYDEVDGACVFPPNVPDSSDIPAQTVTLRFRIPQGIAEGKISALDHAERRHRTAAVRALSRAATNINRYLHKSAGFAQPSTTAPTALPVASLTDHDLAVAKSASVIVTTTTGLSAGSVVVKNQQLLLDGSHGAHTAPRMPRDGEGAATTKVQTATAGGVSQVGGGITTRGAVQAVGTAPTHSTASKATLLTARSTEAGATAQAAATPAKEAAAHGGEAAIGSSSRAAAAASADGGAVASTPNTGAQATPNVPTAGANAAAAPAQ